MEPPSHTHTDLQQSQFIPPPVAVSMEKCQDSQQGSKPCCWWEPSQPSREAGAWAQCKPAPRPSLQGVGAHKWDLAQAGFTPPASGEQRQKNPGVRRRASLAQGIRVLLGEDSISHLAGSRRPVSMMARWKDASGSDATST